MQTLAGVLLPSATVFLLLLCNDREVLGPWANGRASNLVTGTVIAVIISPGARVNSSCGVSPGRR